MQVQLTGVVNGVDYQKSNTGKNGVLYPAKILLKFGWDKEIEKEAGLKSITTGTFTVTVPLENGESLPVEVEKYNKLINNQITLELLDFQNLQGDWNTIPINAKNSLILDKQTKKVS